MYRILIIFLIALMLTGCADAETDSAPLLPTATVTSSPTPTIIWFPPSATPPPQALVTQTPMPDQKPGIGAISLSDNFSSPDLWNPATSNDGSAVINNNHLTLAVPAGFSIFRIRADLIVNDFYAELTASPNLCKGQDEYGMLVRATAVSYYRLVLMCNGTLRLDRVTSRTRLIIQPAIASGDVPTGTPGEVRMGVWAAGPNLHFFLNGHYQFGVSDNTYLSGTLGVFVNSVADTPVAVTFSDLTIYDVNYSPPTKTPNP